MTTRTEYVNYLKSLEGSYGAGAGLDENDVPFNTWYYGRRVKGLRFAWCAVLQCYAENHFDILEQNGGKVAYVPDMPDVAKKVGAQVWVKPKRGSKAYEPGNKIGFDFNKTNEAEHTGTFVTTRDAETFWSVDGNTDNDEVAMRIRRYDDVLFVVETLGLDEKPTKGKADDVPEYVSLGMQKEISVHDGEEVRVNWDKEYGDAGKAHADGSHPGILIGGGSDTAKKPTGFVLELGVSGPVSWRLVETDPKDDYKVTKEYESNRTSYVGQCDAGKHLWVMLKPTGDGSVSTHAKGFYWEGM